MSKNHLLKKRIRGLSQSIFEENFFVLLLLINYTIRIAMSRGIDSGSCKIQNYMHSFQVLIKKLLNQD